MRTRYRYRGRSGDRMYWEARIPGDSRVDEVSCAWDWFWSPERRTEKQARLWEEQHDAVAQNRLATRWEDA